MTQVEQNTKATSRSKEPKNIRLNHILLRQTQEIRHIENLKLKSLTDPISGGRKSSLHFAFLRYLNFEYRNHLLKPLLSLLCSKSHPHVENS